MDNKKKIFIYTLAAFLFSTQFLGVVFSMVGPSGGTDSIEVCCGNCSLFVVVETGEKEDALKKLFEGKVGSEGSFLIKRADIKGTVFISVWLFNADINDTEVYYNDQDKCLKISFVPSSLVGLRGIKFMEESYFLNIYGNYDVSTFSQCGICSKAFCESDMLCIFNCCYCCHASCLKNNYYPECGVVEDVSSDLTTKFDFSSGTLVRVNTQVTTDMLWIW